MLLTPASLLPKKLKRRSLLLRQMMFKEPKKYRIRLPEKLRLSKVTSKRLRTYKRKDWFPATKPNRWLRSLIRISKKLRTMSSRLRKFLKRPKLLPKLPPSTPKKPLRPLSRKLRPQRSLSRPPLLRKSWRRWTRRSPPLSPLSTKRVHQLTKKPRKPLKPKRSRLRRLIKLWKKPTRQSLTKRMARSQARRLLR